jgi:hypothetical protein
MQEDFGCVAVTLCSEEFLSGLAIPRGHKTTLFFGGEVSPRLEPSALGGQTYPAKSSSVGPRTWARGCLLL